MIYWKTLQFLANSQSIKNVEKNVEMMSNELVLMIYWKTLHFLANSQSIKKC
jgi:hypothetical protein